MFSNPIPSSQTGEQSLDIDAMLFDVSNRMARAQLARQISNSSSTFQRKAARVFKPKSTGNSPQYIQRRRATTSFKGGRNRSDLYNHSVAVPHQETLSLNGNGQPTSAPRPMSWHPSSVQSNHAAARTSAYYTPSGYSVAVNQISAPNNVNVPATQQVANIDMINPYLGYNTSSISYQPLNTGYYENSQQESEPNIAYPTLANFDHTDHVQHQNTSMLEGFPIFPPTSSLTQTWTNSLSSLPSYTNPPTPDFLPIQNPSDMWQGYVSNISPSLPKRPSKELVGMGLYDCPNRDSFALETAVDQHFGVMVAHPEQEPAGKGLKLEETWQPPEEDNSSEEDSQDGDEACSVVEVGHDVPPVSDGHEEAQAASFPPCIDLSNQSFYFDNDENYFDGMSFGQAIPAMSANLSGVILGDYTLG